MILHTSLVIALNLVSTLLWATTFFFLLLYITKFPQTYLQYLDVDFLSVKDLTQFAFV